MQISSSTPTHPKEFWSFSYALHMAFKNFIFRSIIRLLHFARIVPIGEQ